MAIETPANSAEKQLSKQNMARDFTRIARAIMLNYILENHCMQNLEMKSSCVDFLMGVESWKDFKEFISGKK